MKKLLMVIPFIFLLCITFSCQQGERVLVEPKEDIEADKQALKNIVADVNAAINAADVDRIVSFYSDDAVRIPPKGPIAFGKEAISSEVEQVFEVCTIQENDVVKEIKVSGDLAVIHVIFSAIITPKAGGEPIEAKGDWLWVLERQANNTWSWTYSIWTSDN